MSAHRRMQLQSAELASPITNLRLCSKGEEFLLSKPARAKKGPEGGASMSFEEIAEKMHCSHQRVCWLYQSALRKLRARPEALARLVALAAELDRSRNERMVRE